MKSLFVKYSAFLEILTLVLLSLVPLLWFKSGQVVVGLDSGYAVDYLKYFDQRIYTWFASQNFGVDFSAEVGVLPFNSGVPALVSRLGVPTLNVQQVVFVFWFFLILLSMYLFTRYLFPEPSKWFIRISACILYAFNLHLYSFWLQGEQTILSSYVIFPLFTLFLLKFAQKKEGILKTAVILNIIYLFFGSGGVRGVPLIGPVILTGFVIFLYYFYVNYNAEKLNYLKRFVFLFFVFIFIFIFLEAYYIFPFLASFSHEFYSQVTIAGGIDGAISWSKFISTHASYLNLFRLHGDNNWYDKPFLWAWNYLTNPVLVIGGFALPVLAFLAPLLVRDRKEKVIILFLVILALVGMIMTAGAHAPLGSFYTFLMKFIPGFATFRSAWYKFIPVIIFSYSILVGYSLSILISKIKMNGRWIISIVAIIALLSYHYVYFTSDNFVYNKPFSTMVKIPDYIYDFAQYENSRPDDFRTLVTPHSNLGFTIKTFKWGYYGSYPIYPLITDKGFVQYDSYLFNDSENALVASLYQNLRENDFESFIKTARISHIRYVMVVKDVAKDYNFAPTEDPASYEKIFSNKRFFRKTWSSGEWQIYEIIGGDTSKKIEVENKITVDNSDYSSVDSLFEGLTTSFIFKSQIDAATYDKLPVVSSFTEYPCVSCVLTSSAPISPVLEYSQINPGSILYKLKLSRDATLLSKTVGSTETDALLGMSLKRLSEIEAVKSVAAQVDAARDTEQALILLNNYWKRIGLKIGTDDTDFQSLQKISTYLDFEILKFKDMYETGYVRESGSLTASLSKVLSQMRKVDEKLKSTLGDTDWNSQFIYNIQDENRKDAKIFINKNSLPVDAQGNSIYPEFYQIDEEASVAARIQSDGEIMGVSPQAKKLKLIFNSMPNLAELSYKQVSLINTEQSCQYVSIKNYSWNKKYIISVTSKSDSIPKTIYIKRDYQLLKTEEFTPPSQEFFNPDLTFSPSNPISDVSTFQFSGQPNDSGASVYFCTAVGQDPLLAFSNITLTELIHPLIYSKTNEIKSEHSLPQVAFTRVNPAYYKVSIKNASGPYILNFKEAYSPNWQAIISGKELPNHFRINGYGNAWIINDKGDYAIEIKFYTQSMFYIGLVTSAGMFILLVGYLIITRLRKK